MTDRRLWGYLSFVSTALATLLLAVLLAACDTSATDRVPSYRLLNEDTTSGVYFVLVEPGLGQGQLRAIVEDLFDRQGGSGRLVVEFYDFPELKQYSGPTLGWAHYAWPRTRFSTEPPVGATPTLSTYFRDVDWSLRPTQTQVDVWMYRQDLAWSSNAYSAARGAESWWLVAGASPQPSAKERKVGGALDRRASRHFDMPLAEVREAVRAVDAWTQPVMGRLPL